MAFLIAVGGATLFAIIGTIWVLYLDKKDKEREQHAGGETHR